MAPKPNNKRMTASIAVEKNAKKPKVDPELGAVLEAIGQVDLPENCRTMLLKIASHALCSPAAERDDVQVMVVKMIEESISGHRNSLEQALAAEQCKVDDIEASRVAREQCVWETKKSLAELAAATEAKRKALGIASQAMIEKKTQVKEAEDAKRLLDAGLAEATENKSSLEAAFANHFRPLQMSSCSSDEVDAHVNVLMPLVNRIFANESSLLTALVSSLPTTPAERGMFDNMVVEQLEDLIQKKVGEITTQLAASETTMREHSAVVEAAQAVYDDACESQKQAANELHIVESTEKEASTAVEEASNSLALFEPEFREATEVRDSKKRIVDAFVSWNVACFEKLRGKSTSEGVAVAKPADMAATEDVVCPTSRC